MFLLLQTVCLSPEFIKYQQHQTAAGSIRASPKQEELNTFMHKANSSKIGGSDLMENLYLYFCPIQAGDSSQTWS